MTALKKNIVCFSKSENAWEHVKLNEIINFYSGLTYTPDDVCTEGTLVLRSSNVYEGEIVKGDNVYVKPDVVNVDNVQQGDIIVVVRNGSRSLIGKHAVIKTPMQNTVIGAFMTGIRTERPSFINALLSSPHFDDEVEKNMGATINQITGYMFANMEFDIPCLEDQDTIGNLFDNLDALLLNQRQKYEALIKLKKSMLQKMFPQNGNNVPEIRFKGFEQPWDKFSFSDITFLAGERNKDSLPLRSFSVSNDKGFIPQDEQFENGGSMAEADKRMYIIVKPNSFVYNPARINVGSIGYSDLNENVIVSSLYEVFQTSEIVHDRFLWHWFKSATFQKMIEQLQEGGVRLYFYYDKLCQGSILLPPISEQQLIGNYFDKLDDEIELQKTKLEKLKNIKSALLRKMFP